MGHPGILKTKELVTQDYWWPGLHTFVTNYLNGCATCQQNKINTHPTAPPLMLIPSKSNQPFADISMDWVTGLPEVDGYNAALVVVDHGLSKGAILMPGTKDVEHMVTAKLIHQNVYRRFGLPDSAILDRGPQFALKVFRELLKITGVKSKLSMAYHPQTDGETEQMNQEMEAYLRMFCANCPEKWPEALSDVEFVHNQ